MDGTLKSQESNTSALDRHQVLVIRNSIVEIALTLKDIPYLYGSEWTDYGVKPKFLDCSEMNEGCFKKIGLRMPDGSQNQFDFMIPTSFPLLGDVAFMGKGKGNPKKIYHAGIVLNDTEIIECRAYQDNCSFETGKVIIRPRINWENYENFAGYRSHPKLI